MLEILRSIYPNSLRILHLDYPYAGATTYLIPTPFPALVELYTTDVFQAKLRDSFVAPALEKLYIGPYLFATHLFGPELKRICPRLTYLRVEPREEFTHADQFLRFVHAYCGLTRPIEDVIDPWAENLDPEPYSPGGYDEVEEVDRENEEIQGTKGNNESEDDGRNNPGEVASVSTDHHFPTTEALRAYVPVIVDESVMPTSLRRVVVEFSPMCIPEEGFECGNGQDDRDEFISAYGSVAWAARRESGIDAKVREDDPDRRSLWVVPTPQDVNEQDWEVHEVQVFQKAREDWLERCGGTGVGYWI